MIRHIREVDKVAAVGNYSHAVVTDAPQMLISGQVSVDAGGLNVAEGDPHGQASAVFDNLKQVLSAAGVGFEALTYLRVYVVNDQAADAYRRVRDERLEPPYPASALLFVARLGRPEWLLEVEAIAGVLAAEIH